MRPGRDDNDIVTSCSAIPVLLRDETRSDVIDVPLEVGCAAMFTARSPIKRTPNEDAALAMETGDGAVVLAVADGCGGIPAGDVAARLALEAIQEQVAGAAGPDALAAAVLEGFGRANRAVMDMGVGAGTTLSVVTVDDGFARAYHAGDSQILITGQRGRLKLNPVAHAPTAYAVEAGLLTERQAIVHQERHVITNMIGAPDMHVEVSSPVALAPRDTVVVASDGVSDNLLVHEVVDLVRTGSHTESLGRLIALCESRMAAADGMRPGKPDDLTVVVYRPVFHSK